MFTFALIVFAVVLSVFINTQIKSWIYSNIIEPELAGLEDGDQPSESIFYTTLLMVVINNLIPLTLGVAIGINAIMR